MTMKRATMLVAPKKKALLRQRPLIRATDAIQQMTYSEPQQRTTIWDVEELRSKLIARVWLVGMEIMLIPRSR